METFRKGTPGRFKQSGRPKDFSCARGGMSTKADRLRTAVKPEPEPGHSPGTARVQITDNKGELTRARVALSPARPRKVPALPRRLYDLEAIRIYLGIPVHTVREIIWRGDLPYVKIGRRQYVDLRDVDQFIEQSKTREK